MRTTLLPTSAFDLTPRTPTPCISDSESETDTVERFMIFQSSMCSTSPTSSTSSAQQAHHLDRARLQGSSSPPEYIQRHLGEAIKHLELVSRVQTLEAHVLYLQTQVDKWKGIADKRDARAVLFRAMLMRELNGGSNEYVCAMSGALPARDGGEEGRGEVELEALADESDGSLEEEAEGEADDAGSEGESEGESRSKSASGGDDSESASASGSGSESESLADDEEEEEEDEEALFETQLSPEELFISDFEAPSSGGAGYSDSASMLSLSSCSFSAPGSSQDSHGDSDEANDGQGQNGNLETEVERALESDRHAGKDGFGNGPGQEQSDSDLDYSSAVASRTTPAASSGFAWIFVIAVLVSIFILCVSVWLKLMEKQLLDSCLRSSSSPWTLEEHSVWGQTC